MPNFEDTTLKTPRPPVRLFRLLIDQYDQALDMREADMARTFLRTLGLAIKHELGEEQKQPFNASFTISGEDVLLAIKRGLDSDNRFRSVNSIVRNGDTIGELSEGQFESGPKAPVLGKVNSADLFDRIKQLLPGIKPVKAPEPTIPASALKQFDEVVAGLRQAAEVLSTVSRPVSVSPSGGIVFGPALSLAERMGLDLGTTTKSQWDRLQEFAKGNAVEPYRGPSLEKLKEVLGDKAPEIGAGDLVFLNEGFDGSTYIVQFIDGERIRIRPCREIALGKGGFLDRIVDRSELGFIRKAGDFPAINVDDRFAVDRSTELSNQVKDAERPKRESTDTSRAEPG